MIEDWLPRVHDILNSTAMTSCTRSALGVPDTSQALEYMAMYAQGREILDDPLSPLGPPAPHYDLTMDELFADIESGKLQPMAAPRDANGRANAPYESVAFAPTSPPTEIGRMDVTSLPAKFVAFWSDGLPVGFTHTETLIVKRLKDVRVTNSVHRLTAFDRDDGPESIEGLTTAATVSGYMVYTEVIEDAEVSHDSRRDGDPTASIEVGQHSQTYFGAFYPDAHAGLGDPRGRGREPDQWTFTTSASPMMDDWGTWHAM